MPKVLRIINRFNIGGPTYNAAYLSKYLSEDFETLLVGGQKDESEDSSEFIVEKLGLSPIIIPEMKREINFKDDKIAYQKLKQIIADFQPDIVHTHASKAGAIGRLAARKMNVPVILHTFHGHVFHSYFGKAKTTMYKNIERYLAKKSSSIIAISEIQKRELVQEHHICTAEKVKVIPLGFDLNRFREDTTNKRNNFRTEWNISKQTIAIGIIGRLVPIKNHHFFLRVVNNIRQLTQQEVRFFIVGDGELKADLMDYCNTLNLPYTTRKDTPALVTFTSWIKDIDRVNAGLDIITLTSKNEGTPVSLIEAQASSKPIVSTNVGGIENVVKLNKTAFLSAIDDEETFTQNLLNLIHNAQLREQMSHNGQHVFESFHFQRLVKDMEAHYYELLGKKHSKKIQ
ncbi:MAG: glycosyltransferase [Flavobacteriales bacterium]|jgi:glycosyltransferase involved in cell wall biosynthesis|nr:glycosyltransferase [Flavobacteriales bacterium]